MLNIRTPLASDMQAMLNLYAPYILDTVISFEIEVPTLKQFCQRVQDVMSQYPWYVFEIEGKIAGFAYASQHKYRAAYQWCAESSIYLDPSFHGQGIGKKLYIKLLDTLKRQGYRNIYAGITIPNHASVGLHESLGFKKIGVFEKSGFKQGLWLDVGWWGIDLFAGQSFSNLKPPIKFNQNFS